MIEYNRGVMRSFMHQLHLRTYNVHLAVYICTYLCNCTPMYVQSTRAIWHSQCRAEIRQQRNPCRAINFERRKKESSMKTHFERLNLGRKQAKEDEDAFRKIWTTARLLNIGSAVRLDGMSEWIKETQSQTTGFEKPGRSLSISD